MSKRTTYRARTTCQVCREEFDDKLDRDVHVSTAHDLRRNGADTVLEFLACTGSQCHERVFIGHDCDKCGTHRSPLVITLTAR